MLVRVLNGNFSDEETMTVPRVRLQKYESDSRKIRATELIRKTI